ncbi:hypothetical protein F5B19DRAFT_42782 [Rostrohypoxylon terebratum]|nr:hypothetical protein F5B19DRAFT_42782 [Rostrohypoxylon terebratum]
MEKIWRKRYLGGGVYQNRKSKTVKNGGMYCCIVVWNTIFKRPFSLSLFFHLCFFFFFFFNFNLKFFTSVMRSMVIRLTTSVRSIVYHVYICLYNHNNYNNIMYLRTKYVFENKLCLDDSKN